MIEFIFGLWAGGVLAVLFVCCFKITKEEHETD